MKKMFRKGSSLVIAVAVIVSLFTVLPVYASAYLHQDEDASLDSKWTKVENYDDTHGNVYSFAAGHETAGTDLFSSNFEDGTYIVSMDFNVPVFPASGKYIDIYVDTGEANRDRAQLSLRTEGYKGYSVTSGGADVSGWHVTYGNVYAANAWNNYSLVYVKSGTNVSISQYVNGILLSGPFAGTSDFRLRRITVNTSNSDGAVMYLDNIICKKIADQEQLNIDSVKPVMGKNSSSTVKSLTVKFNNVLASASVSSVQVVKQGGSSNIVSSYRIAGQYIYIDVTSLTMGEGYTLTVNQGVQSITGNEISTNTYTKAQAETAYSYIYQDEDASLDSKWTKTEDFDIEHGDVYSFAAGRETAGTDLFSSNFEDGTYVVSMDFNVPVFPASGKYIDIYVDTGEANRDRAQLSLRTEGYKGYSVSSGGADVSGWHVTYGDEYTADAWNNYTVLYEKSGTTINISQYVNGKKLSGPYAGTSDFRLRRITVNTSNSDGAVIYLDNIMCRKVSGSALNIESIYPISYVGSEDRVRSLAVKFTEPLDPATVGNVSVVKTEDNLAGSYSVVGQYLYVKVNGLLRNDGFTFAVGSETVGISGNPIGETSFVKAAETQTVPYLHKDEDASLESWTKVTGYDDTHGDVYSLSAGVEHKGATWYESGFEDGTYIVSMDFKVPAYPASGKQDIIMLDSETWKDRTSLYLKTDGVLAYEIRDEEASRQDYAYKWGTNYAANAWNNYSVVYEKSGTNVDVTQYVNGIKVKAAATRVYDNYRFKQIRVLTDASSSGVYLDNITCRKIDDSEKFAIENVAEIGSAGIGTLAVKFNQVINPSSLTSVSVIKEETETNVISSYTVVGQYMYINVSDLDQNDGYTIRFNNGFASIAGKGLALSAYTKAADNTETVAYWVCDGSYSDNIDAVAMAGGSNPSVGSVGGKSCCSISGELLFTLNDNIKPIAFDGSEYRFEIEYYDGTSSEKNKNGAANFFQLIYNQYGRDDLNLDTVVYKNGTSAWKTAVITLNNANFYDNYSGDCDFKISTNGILPSAYQTDTAAVNPVKIHSVRITREVAKNPVFVTSSTSVSGNSFAWYSSDKTITNTYKNVSDVSRNITAVTKLTDLSGAESFRDEKNISILPGVSTTSVIDFSSLTECGLFDVCVDIIENSVTVSSFETSRVAILKADPNGVKDKNIFLSAQTEAYDEPKSQVAADILDLMNVAGARVGLSWNRMLVKNSNNEYVLDWNSDKNKNLVTALKARGMTSLGLISGCPATDKEPNSPGYGHIPTTQEHREAFNEFAEYVGANVVKDGVSYIELFNEPNLSSNNPNLEATGTEYAEMAISAKNALITAAQGAGVTDLKVAGPGVTGIQYSTSHPTAGVTAGTEIGGYDYIRQAVENGFANSFDNLSFHFYTWSTAESISSKVSAVNNIQKLWTDRGLAKPNLWVTEAGYFKGASYSETDLMQGAQNIRQILAQKQNGIFADVYSIYALERKGYNPALKESNFGLINPLFADLSIEGCYGLPTESAIMLAAMCYVMPNAEFVSTETIETANSDIVVSKFTSDKWDGKQIVTAYNLEDSSETVAINLGVNKVKCFDEYGNESMLTSGNGVYNVEIGVAPIYFVADFDGESGSDVSISVVANGIEYGKGEISSNLIDFSNLTVKIDNAAMLPNEFVLVTAFYKDGKIASIKNKSCSKSQIVDNTVQQTIASIPEYDSVKVTLWNSFESMKPICGFLEGK